MKRLRSISNENGKKDDVHLGLLIGANCMKPLKPTKIIHNEGGDPYANKTRLGW